MNQSFEQEIQLAQQYLQEGKLDEAQKLCGNVLKEEPENGLAVFTLGLIAYQQQIYEQAFKLLQQSVNFGIERPDCYLALANLYRMIRQDNQQAIQFYHKAIQLNSNMAEAYFNLGLAHQDLGQRDLAIGSLQSAIRLSPQFFPAHYSLGGLYESLNKYAQAEECYRQIAVAQPEDINIIEKLALMLLLQGKNQEAIQVLQEALKLNPDSFQLHFQLGNAFAQSQQLEQALYYYQKTTKLNIHFPEAYLNAGVLLQQQKKWLNAIESYSKTLDLTPNSLPALTNAAFCAVQLKDYFLARTYFEQILIGTPHSVTAKQGLASILCQIGQLKQGIELYQQLLATDLEDKSVYSSYLFYLCATPEKTKQDIMQAALLWAKKCGFSESITPLYPADADPDKRLRVGFISTDFCARPGAFFLMSLFKHFNKDKFEFYCYADSEQFDNVSKYIQTLVHHWRGISQLNNSQLAQLIKEDKIDVLIDVTGHAKQSRLVVFANRAAPVQLTWYPTTTGVKSIDYRLSDRYLDPPEEDNYSVEKLMYFPHSILCYSPPDNVPDIEPAPYIRNGFVTLGSFNNLVKLNEEVIALWASILKQSPGTKFMLKYFKFEEKQIQEYYCDLFQKYGVDSSRIIFVGATKLYDEHMAYYHQIDLALDPFPFSGMTTTCEALWMGVPVVSLIGETVFSRAGLSILSTLKLTELLAHSKDNYVKIVKDLIQQPEKLSQLRQNMRSIMKHSPLMDAKGYARAWEKFFREAWINMSSSF